MRVDETYQGCRQGELRAGRRLLQAAGLRGYHDARAAFACERYHALIGHPAPVVVGGQREADREADGKAREVIAVELGHGRTEVVAAYIGSAR